MRMIVSMVTSLDSLEESSYLTELVLPQPRRAQAPVDGCPWFASTHPLQGASSSKRGSV